jgi:hypothetical protein
MPPQQYPSSPNYPPVPVTPHSKRRMGGLLIPFILTVLFLLAALIFAIWAFSERQDYKNNVDQKIETAVTIATERESTRKDNEFLEREKSPYKIFTGPETYGSLSFKYPKTWSGYVIETGRSTTPLDGYFHPKIVPDVDGDTAFALRIQIVNRPYDQVLSQFESKVGSGKVTVIAYSPKKVSGVSGSRINGEIYTGQQDTMILLPIRDKTLQIWTESQEFVKDFDSIILANLKFVP